MVDARRVYRRWMAVRLATIVPVLALALGANTWVAFETAISAWLKVTILFGSLIVAGLLGYLVLATWQCVRLLARGGSRASRGLRNQTAGYRSMAVGGALILGGLLSLPLMFRATETGGASHLEARRRGPVEVLLPSDPPAAEVPVERVAPSDSIGPLEEAAAPAPEIRPIAFEIPVALSLEDREGTDDRSAAEEPGDLLGEGEDEALPQLSLDGLIRRPETDWVAERMGASGVLLHLPLEEGGWIQVGLGTEGSESWQRIVAGLVYRLDLEFPLSLAVVAGMAVDGVALDGESVATGLSPYLALDAVLGRGSPLGILLHAGWAEGAGLFDLAAGIRLNLSEQAYFHVGYRLLMARGTDGDVASRIEMADAFTGPGVGLEVRF